MNNTTKFTAAAVALISAIAAGAVISAANDPSPARPPAPATVGHDGARGFSAFAKADDKAGDPAYRARLKAHLPDVDARLDPQTLRDVRHDKNIDVYAMAGTDAICVAVKQRGPGAVGSVSCADPTRVQAGDDVISSSQTSSGGYLVTAFAADGVDQLTLTLSDGTQRVLAVEDNAAYAEVPVEPASLEWTSADGTSHSQDASIPQGTGADG